MKDSVKTMYNQVTMPQGTEEKIRQALAEKKTPVRRGMPARRIAAAAAVLILMLTLSPSVRAAVEDLVDFLDFGNGLSLFVEKDAEGNTTSITGYYHTEQPAWAKYENSRLYFLGNGEHIDITDVITEEEPYFYGYTDELGYEHIMAVGYSGELNNFGIYEFIKDLQGDWITGAGRNFLSPGTETRYPWVDAVWEKLQIPWPMPGEDSDVNVTITENEIELTIKGKRHTVGEGQAPPLQ